MFKTHKLAIMAVTGVLTLTMGLSACGEKQQATETPAAETTTETPAAETSVQAEPEAQAEAQLEATAPVQVNSQQSAPQAQTTVSPDEYIGYDEAKRIALADAGLNEADCRKLEVELDTDDYYIHYDVEFKADMYEYDYDIDAVTGEILFSKAEYDD